MYTGSIPVLASNVFKEYASYLIGPVKRAIDVALITKHMAQKQAALFSRKSRPNGQKLCTAQVIGSLSILIHGGPTDRLQKTADDDGNTNPGG